MRKYPVGPDVMACVAVGISLQVVLMLELCLPQRAGRRNFGDHFAWPNAGGIHVGDGVLSNALLLVAGVVNRRTITGDAVVPLPIQRRRIMYLKEEFEQFAIAQLCRVKDNLDCLSMSSMVAVGGIGNVAAGISYPAGNDPRIAAQPVLHSLKTATSQNRFFLRGCHATSPLWLRIV